MITTYHTFDLATNGPTTHYRRFDHWHWLQTNTGIVFFVKFHLLQYFIQKEKMRHLEWIYRTCSWRREHISDRWLPPPAAKCAPWSESCSAAIIRALVPCTGKNTIWQLLAANKSNEIIRLSLITLLHIQEQLICLSNQFHTAKYHWVLAVKAMLSWGVPYVESRNRVKILIWKSHETVCWNV